MINQLWLSKISQDIANEIERYNLVCGIDEVGRGPIAGPVLACAIIMPSDHFIDGVKDSKKLTPKRREMLFEAILEECLAYGIGLESEKTIERINIRQATLLAMKEAIFNLKDKNLEAIDPDLLVIDHERLDLNKEQLCLDKADDKIYQVACASIVAKVIRDRIMVEYGKKIPQYCFESHKGYGTKKHYEAIKKYGLLPIHRRTFLHGDDLFKNEKYESEELDTKALYDDIKRKGRLG